MVVTCQQCGTKFNLDENLITRDIVRVRCSHCQHVFTVAGPKDRPELTGVAADLGEELTRPAEPDIPPEEPVATPAPPMEPEAPAATETVELTVPAEAASVPEEPVRSFPEVAAMEPKKTSRTVMVAIISGCLLGLLLALLALWYSGGKKVGPPQSRTAAESLTPPLPPTSPEELRKLVVELKDARYQGLVNAKGLQLLVIQGDVNNLTGEPRGPIRLKATLTDALNQPVQELLFFSGTSLTDEELLQTDPEEIKRWLATPGGRGGPRVVKPGDSQPFTAVLFGVPDNLAEARFGFNIVVLDGPRIPVE